jgi:glycosyltransferase involved in cell wall biosynthesis
MEETFISVIIPTFKSPYFLDLCLRSAIEGQQNKNQIIVVVDGFYELNKEVLEKWSEYIDVLNLEQNVGLCRGTNLGVYNAKYDKILIVNDDNVFPVSWDKYLLEAYEPNSVISPNQIEPKSSIFPQFIIKDFGANPTEFNLNDFWEFEPNNWAFKPDETGSTLPIFMSKIDYLRVGGWDENYEQGMVADCDFFLKCRLSNLKMLRTYNCHFYHFASVSVNGEKRQNAEIIGHEYFKYKWGYFMKRDKNNNIVH